VGSCQHSNELTGSIKDREVLNKLSDNYFLRKDSMYSVCNKHTQVKGSHFYLEIKRECS